jgi:hypothetical protein
MTSSPAILGYRRFLEARDGTPDAEHDTLSRREAFFRALEERPVRSARIFDRAAFLRNLARARPEPGLDERMLWLLATAKVNQGERFGVELGKLYGMGAAEDGDPERIHVILQETYPRARSPTSRPSSDSPCRDGLPRVFPGSSSSSWCAARCRSACCCRSWVSPRERAA